MDIGNLTLEITTVFSLIGFVITGSYYWFKADKRITLLEHKVKDLVRQNIITHKRIDSMKEEMVKINDSLSEKYDGLNANIQKLEVKMNENKAEIIEAIYKINGNN